ncbi:MAG: aminotransferase, partial [Actinomycetota bacterium]|nr:aminotransferase [Actinomycetota bacterium]
MRADSCLLEPHTDLAREDGPHVVTRGEGAWVVDVHGRRYLEGVAGLFSASLGFGEERLAKAAERQLRRLPFYGSFGHRTHDVALELAARLVAMAPMPMGRALFANSGSEAIDSAIKVAWLAHDALGRAERRKLIAHDRGYHGSTVAAASLTGLPRMHRGFGPPAVPVVRVPTPDRYRDGRPGESEEEFGARLAAAVERTIQAEGPETVAAFVSEPVLGAGGVVVPPRAYFDRLQEVLRRHGVLFVVDEVITGFGRTGRMFGSETFGLRPDMLVLAKGLSAGYMPISALLVSEELDAALVEASRRHGSFSHGFTCSGHPVAAAVALEALAIYEEIDVAARARAAGALLRDRLAPLAEHPLVGDVRGCGLLAGVELVRGAAARTVARAQAHGLILRAMGDTVAFAPPLVVGPREVELTAELFGRALEDVAGDLLP